jgi:hypothetical protein
VVQVLILARYDLHGIWDSSSQFVGAYVAPHTNLTEIDLGLNLLWRAGVDANKVVLGQGWVSLPSESYSCFVLTRGAVRTLVHAN